MPGAIGQTYVAEIGTDLVTAARNLRKAALRTALRFRARLKRALSPV